MATYQWSETNLVGAVVTDGITNLNFGSVDGANIVVATYPVTAGQNSYEKYIRAKFSGSFNEISNMKFWKSSGTVVTGESIKAAANVAYVQPVNTTSVVATSDVPESSATALAIQSAAGTTTITVAGYTKYVCIQAQTTTATPAGSVNQKTFTFQYDEV